MVGLDAFIRLNPREAFAFLFIANVYYIRIVDITISIYSFISRA